MREGFNPGRLEGAGTPFEWPQATGHGRQPYASVVSGPGQLVAGPNGLQLGIFGWADPVTGEVSNTEIAGGILGFVLPVRQLWNWQRVYRQITQPCPEGPPAMILRAGLECVLAAAGDFFTVFPFGCQAGKQVFADPATGLPSSGNPGGFVATPWTVMESACHCNARCRISSFVTPVH